MVNNMVRGVGGGNIPGLIFSPDSYSFENGIFVKNHIECFLAGNALLFIKKCAMDRDIVWAGAVAADVIGCITSFANDEKTPPSCRLDLKKAITTSSLASAWPSWRPS
jgi:hypothetical protein